MTDPTIVQQILEYSYVGIVVALVLEFLGLPIPGEALLILAGSQADQGPLQVLPLIASGVVGSMLGYALAFEIGRRVGMERLVRWGRYARMKEQHWTWGEQLWVRYSLLLLIISRYVTGVRHVTPYLAGLTHMPSRSFYSWNVIGSVAWVVPLVLAGGEIGENWEEIEAWFRRFGLITGIVVIAATLVIWRFSAQVKNKRRER